MSAVSSKQAVRALRQDIMEANDQKLLQIVALLDSASEHQVSEAVLDPLRPRLAALKPIRSLRFSRLLAIPLDDLIVPAAVWKPGQAAIPRSVLKVMTAVVRAELGREVEQIDRTIAGHDTDNSEIITEAGQALWPRASEILARAQQRTEWDTTGLRPNAYGPLVRAIAAVLQRATRLRSLFLDAELGVLEPDEEAVRALVSNMAGDPPEGCAMVFKLLLGRLPHAISLLRPFVDQSRTTAERALLQSAMDRGTRDLLDDMEARPDVAEGLRDGSLAAVGAEVRRIAGLLRDINHDPNSARHRVRVQGLREKLDAVCRGRFVEAMDAGVVSRLAATSVPMDQTGHTQMENCARDLRSVEKAGRKLGNAATYDSLLAKATDALQAAAHDGTLSTVRAVRLVEILSGPDAAEELYKSAARSVTGQVTARDK
jgi:hypothetical protein